MSRTGSSTVTTTAEVLSFQSDNNKGGQIADGPPARAIRVNCTSASAGTLLVRIPSLHGASAQVTIPIGENREFIDVRGPGNAGGIDRMYLQGGSGTATYTFEVTA